MAWRSTAASNAELVANLEANSFVTSAAVRSALLATDRALYVPDSEPGPSQTYDYGPYADAPQSIGHKVTISAPHVHALALEALRPLLVRDGCRALDVGCGSGVLLACMARMGAAAVGLEVVAPLVELSIRNLRRDGFAPNSDPALVVEHGDGWTGAAAHAPFDAIHVGAAAPEVPAALLAQLKAGGRLVIPLGDREQQTLTLVEKAADGGVAHTSLQRVKYVPLIRPSPPTPPVPDGSVDYDERYRRGWAYGKEATAFVAEAAASSERGHRQRAVRGAQVRRALQQRRRRTCGSPQSGAHGMD